MGENPVPAGRRPVHVTIQWRAAKPSGQTRADRKAALAAGFRALLASAEHVRVDWDSVSVTAQTVEAFLDPDHAQSAKAALQALGLRVDLVVDRQISC